jgi:hypothetical protein
MADRRHRGSRLRLFGPNCFACGGRSKTRIQLFVVPDFGHQTVEVQVQQLLADEYVSQVEKANLPDQAGGVNDCLELVWLTECVNP